MDYTFKSTIFILPGLGNSGETHWQSIWEKQFGFIRIHQKDWETPDRNDWIDTIENTIASFDLENVILVGHSLACSTIAYWAQKYPHKIKGALLVAPSDTEADSYPKGTTGYSAMPIHPIPFKTITVASSNDFYVTIERANYFAKNWGSKLVNLGDCGHINGASDLGEWPLGLTLLQELDN